MSTIHRCTPEELASLERIIPPNRFYTGSGFRPNKKKVIIVSKCPVLEAKVADTLSKLGFLCPSFPDFDHGSILRQDLLAVVFIQKGALRPDGQFLFYYRKYKAELTEAGSSLRLVHLQIPTESVAGSAADDDRMRYTIEKENDLCQQLGMPLLGSASSFSLCARPASTKHTISLKRALWFAMGPSNCSSSRTAAKRARLEAKAEELLKQMSQVQSDSASSSPPIVAHFHSWSWAGFRADKTDILLLCILALILTRLFLFPSLSS